MLLTLAAFIFVIGVLIFVHELGHFLAAKSIGIGVPRFSIGLGPATPIAFRRGETEYVLSWIPFGGYVKMASKEEQEEVGGALEGGRNEEVFPPEKLFENKPLWGRIMVISAGVTMNFLFAWLVYVGLAATFGAVVDPTTTLDRIEAADLPVAASALADVSHGDQVLRINGDTVETWNDIFEQVTDPTSPSIRFEFRNAAPVFVAIDGFEMEERFAVYRSLIPMWEARIGSIAPGSAADDAGFRADDLVRRANSEAIDSWGAMVGVVESSMGDTVRFDVLREGAEVTLLAVPRPFTVTDSLTGEERQIGRLGVGQLPPVTRVRLGPVGGIVRGTRQTVSDAKLILLTLKRLLTGDVSPRELGGPVLVGQISGQVAQQGFVPLLSFMALFSINLAILNLLPIPVLDGGQLVFLIIEGIRGRPMPLALRIRFSQFGLIILLGIMALAFTNDILRVFG